MHLMSVILFLVICFPPRKGCNTTKLYLITVTERKLDLCLILPAEVWLCTLKLVFAFTETI